MFALQLNPCTCPLHLRLTSPWSRWSVKCWSGP